MTLTRRSFTLSAAAAGTLALLGRGAQAQPQPPDLAKIVVGFPAGSTPDILSRKVADHLGRGYAKAAVVENRTGAGGQLAVIAMKTAAADGATVLLTPMTMVSVYPYTYRKLPYDPVADLTPVSMGVTFDAAVAVGPSVPESVKTVTDLMAWYKANPNQATIGSPATGSTLHFAGIMLGRASGVEVTHVGFRGSQAAIQDVLGGTLPALCSPLGEFLRHIPTGKLRVIGTSGARRSRFTPTVPTFAEQGYKDLAFSEWYGFYLPARTPQDIVRRLNAALQQALAAPDVVEQLAGYGLEAAWSTPEQLAGAQRAAADRWGPIVKAIGFTAES